MTRTSTDGTTLSDDSMRRTPAVYPQAGFTDGAADPADGAGQIPAADMAAYMADMLMELRTMARQSGFDTLGRVLEIAESEAKLRMGDRG